MTLVMENVAGITIVLSIIYTTPHNCTRLCPNHDWHHARATNPSRPSSWVSI